MQKQDKSLAAISAETIGEIIQMALSDHVSFEQIRALHGLGPNEVQALMKRELKRGKVAELKATPDAAPFAVVHLHIRLMELLHLGPQHRRAQFVREGGWVGHWVAP